MTTINARTTEKEIAHLVRRVGFGGSKEEIDFLSNKSYEESVDYLIDNLDEKIFIYRFAFKTYEEAKKNLDEIDKYKDKIKSINFSSSKRSLPSIEILLIIGNSLTKIRADLSSTFISTLSNNSVATSRCKA